MGISQKLIELIGNESVQSWAEKHGLAKQTVHEWLKHDRMPGKNSLNMLAQATGKTTDWWLGTEDKLYLSEEEAVTGFKILSEKLTKYESNQTKKTIYPPEDTIYIEHYSDVRAAAGNGQVTPTDQTIIQVAVNASDWRNYVGLNHKNVKIITVYGDSMKPTFAHGDQVLVDTACHEFIDDGVYAIQQGDLLRVKRIKLRLDGSIEVKSDNTQGFTNDVYKADEAADFKIYGRVLPFKFGKIDL